MDTSICLTTHGTSHAVLARANFSSDLPGLEKIERLYCNPKTRKRLFRKVEDVEFKDGVLFLYYSSKESVARVKRFSGELLDALFAEVEIL